MDGVFTLCFRPPSFLLEFLNFGAVYALAWWPSTTIWAPSWIKIRKLSPATRIAPGAVSYALSGSALIRWMSHAPSNAMFLRAARRMMKIPPPSARPKTSFSWRSDFLWSNMPRGGRQMASNCTVDAPHRWVIQPLSKKIIPRLRIATLQNATVIRRWKMHLPLGRARTARQEGNDLAQDVAVFRDRFRITPYGSRSAAGLVPQASTPEDVEIAPRNPVQGWPAYE